MSDPNELTVQDMDCMSDAANNNTSNVHRLIAYVGRLELRLMQSQDREMQLRKLCLVCERRLQEHGEAMP